MAKFKPKERKVIVEEEMDITPMIDCTFLLLIFFLVASRMDAAPPLNLPPAKHGGAVVVQQAVVLTITKGDEDRAKIFKGDGPSEENRITGSSPQDEEEAVTQYVEESRSRNSQLKFVLIKAEQGIKHREVARVAKAAGSAEIEQLFVAVLEPQ